jgi:hypothetical protein
MEGLILVVTLGGPTMFARIGVMLALNRHVERVFNADRKEHHLGQAQAGAGSMTEMPRRNSSNAAGAFRGRRAERRRPPRKMSPKGRHWPGNCM